jgi:hypothetical protein
VELGSGVRETAKAQEEWFAGVFVVLMRVGVKALASCSELSTGQRGAGRVELRAVVARAEEGSRGGKQGRGREGATRGSSPSRRWSGGGSTMAAAWCSAPAVESSRGAEGCQRKKKGGRGPKDLCAKLKDSRGLSVKQNFPLV